MSIRSIICVYILVATVTVTLAVNRQVRINQPNTIEATPQDVLQEADVAGNASYEFAYDVNDPLSNDVKSQREIRDGENVYGYYTFKEADGSTRVVNYKVGPKTGFEATVERLEIGDRPEIKKPESRPQQIQQTPQETRDNARVDQRRSRGRGPAARPPPPTGGAARNYVEPQKVNTFSKPPGVNVNQYVQATAPEYEYYTYIQDEKPLPGSPVDSIGRRPSRVKPTTSDIPLPNLQPDQDWKNSVNGRKHIREQIALLAKKKAEEEAQKAEQAKQELARQQQTTLPPVTEALSTDLPTTTLASKEEKPGQQAKEPEQEEEDKSEEEDDEYRDDDDIYRDDDEEEEE